MPHPTTPLLLRGPSTCMVFVILLLLSPWTLRDCGGSNILVLAVSKNPNDASSLLAAAATDLVAPIADDTDDDDFFDRIDNLPPRNVGGVGDDGLIYDDESNVDDSGTGGLGRPSTAWALAIVGVATLAGSVW